jgi:hypothetical protein
METREFSANLDKKLLEILAGDSRRSIVDLELSISLRIARATLLRTGKPVKRPVGILYISFRYSLLFVFFALSTAFVVI